MAITEYEDRIKALVDKEDHEEFIFDFLSIYDKISKATITKLRNGNNNHAKEPGEVHLKNKLYFKETSQDVLQTFANLEDKVNAQASKPRYIIVTDYQQLLAKDMNTLDSLDIQFKELPRYFDFFLAWNGIEKADFEKENPADLKAAERFAKLFDAILKENENADRHALNLFLIRTLFCLFAEDTGIFDKLIFTTYLKQMTAPDGSDFNERIRELFDFLDKAERTGNEPAYLSKFPYVNGQLFTESHMDLVFNEKIRDLIIEAGELIGWSDVNPDILGSMLQAVASDDKRSHLGMHYTSVPNIMKVIKPLFLDDLYEDFEAAKGNEEKLAKLYTRIGHIKFMDPACGSGNFLIITYKELRQLELAIYQELRKLDTGIYYVPSVNLSQFYGIEIEDFAVDVTRLSLWIAEHQMNKILEEKVDDAVRPLLPLQSAGAIVCGNALRLDWEEVMPHNKDEEVYIFGNPPYLGAKLQSKDQKMDLAHIFGEKVQYKKLDYISGWFYKAVKLIKQSNKIESAFVSTNSITQGEQVSILWNPLLDNIEISFAYESFKWNNNAKNNAGVMVVIIGLCNGSIQKSKKIFLSDGYKVVNNISPYISDSDNIIVYPLNITMNGLPNMVVGSMPRDGGNLILSEKEKKQLEEYDIKDNILREYIGAQEFINGKKRYCLWLNKSLYNKYENISEIKERIQAVKEYRLASNAESTRKAADYSWEFVQKGEYEHAYGYEIKNRLSIIIPSVSSEHRLYVPMGFVEEDTVISNLAMAIYDAPIWLLGLLQSRMHMVWLKAVGGKLETRYRYSASLVYNTFPVPELSTRRKNEIEDLVLNILDIRDEEGGTLAELYGSPLAEKNPKPMNPRLLKAHQELDEVVDRAYKKSGFKDDNERLSLLLKMYSEKVKELEGNE
ncbi:class I SAM-dependent DNA methyltransferase [Enterococcus cecorum]|uniref:site-specific DNA-methyltransferase (adenine-specific) n=1 Tax=Enterococcus cecorum TaxID=44008 RepID=A0AAW8TU70_9ENTE|nr:DNA methyltransferase [Enterococcus cecorum]MDT2797610.1 class I SAM-dependent DNA methyltransferase [Enterococcus cecorum]